MTDMTISERARSAATLADECEVLTEAVAMLGGQGDRAPLWRSIVDVRHRGLPRAVLLGVVSALKPESISLAVCDFSADCGKAIAKAGPRQANAEDLPWVEHESASMAALIAVLGAIVAGEG